ncbi:MAG: signal peptidase I [Firmicutes bacterium]|nr:signal peptidase I [Bacillota bacterium]
MKTTKKTKSALQEWLEAIVGSIVLTAFIIIFIAQSFSVQGLSMMPTLQNNQRLLVDKISYRFTEPRKGDIIVFKYPQNPKEEFIKRIIGVPGDSVAIIDGKLFINGQLIEEDYILEPTIRGFLPQVVPEGHYFVLGDNRNNSLDSRDFRVGFVPKDLIIGRAIWSYWPLNKIEIVRRPQVLAELDE